LGIKVIAHLTKRVRILAWLAAKLLWVWR
jgi:hypothetical protein